MLYIVQCGASWAFCVNGKDGTFDTSQWIVKIVFETALVGSKNLSHFDNNSFEHWKQQLYIAVSIIFNFQMTSLLTVCNLLRNYFPLTRLMARKCLIEQQPT